MSSDDNHWRVLIMTRTARNICTCAVFATTSFNFGLPTYFVSHGYCYGRALYAVFYRRAELFDCGVSNDMSKVTHISWCASWWHNVFVLLVQFALVHFVWLRQKLVFLSLKKTTVHINLLEYFCFLEIDVCVFPSLCWLCSLSDILARHDLNI